MHRPLRGLLTLGAFFAATLYAFDLQLKWTPDESQFTGMRIKAPRPTDSPDAPPDLFTALQEQLGLKLTAPKAPADLLVMDRVEKPSGN